MAGKFMPNLTERGKLLLKIAQEAGLAEFYDTQMGCYFFSMDEFEKDPDIHEKCIELLKKPISPTENFALELIEDPDSDAGWMYSIRDVKSWV